MTGTLAAILSVALAAGTPPRGEEPDDSFAMERLRQVLREIIERQQQIRGALRDSFPP